MIGMLTGRVESVETDTALIDVGGVGYEVRMSATDLSRLHAGQDTRVFTYMNLSGCHYPAWIPGSGRQENLPATHQGLRHWA